MSATAKTFGPLSIAPCENCGQPSHKQCSRRKAFSVCRQACMVALWHKHKVDCDIEVQAQNRRKHVPKASASIEPESLLRLDCRGLDAYEKHDVNEPHGRS